jgi:hypothetical protein
MADDRKRTTLLSTTTSATSSRIGRLSSLTLSSSKFEPVPIILEISSTVIRVGFAGEKSRPQHVLRIEGAIFDSHDYDVDSSTSKKMNKTKTESEWYLILSPLIEQVYDRVMCKPSTRRVVCLYSNQRYAPLPFRRALRQHLWNRGVPATVELDPLEVLPIAQGWTRGLAVNVTREEAYCVCLADGYTLPYTYQMVPSGGYKNWLHPQTKNGVTEYVLPEQPKDPKDDKNDNDPSISSLVVAILVCLQKCPLDLRLNVVSNVVFCGDGVLLLPDLPRRVMKRVRDILRSENKDADETRNGKDANASLSTIPDTSFGSVPLDVTGLRALASSVALISCAPYRADSICWVGASLWAAVWNKYNDEETPIPWVLNKD